MARGRRRPVRCRSCGYVTTPVSGFCPNCLERLPPGRRFGLVPIVAIAGLLAVGVGIVAASSRGSIALRPLTTEEATTASPTAAATSVAVAVASTSATPSSTAGRSGSPTSPPSPSAAISISPSPSPTAVLGSQSTPTVTGASTSSGSSTLPSTTTSDGARAETRRGNGGAKRV